METGSKGFSSYAHNLWRLHWSTFFDELLEDARGEARRPSLVGHVRSPGQLGSIELPDVVDKKG